MMAGVCGLIDHLRFLGHALQPEPTLGDQPNTYTAPHVQINLKYRYQVSSFRKCGAMSWLI